MSQRSVALISWSHPRARDTSCFSAGFKVRGTDFRKLTNHYSCYFPCHREQITDINNRREKGFNQASVGESSVYRLWLGWLRPLVEKKTPCCEPMEKAICPVTKPPGLGWHSASLTSPRWCGHQTLSHSMEAHLTGLNVSSRPISQKLGVEEELILSKP